MFLPVRRSWLNEPTVAVRPEGVVELDLGQQPRVEGSLGALRLNLQSAIEVEPQAVVLPFTL